MTIFPVGISRLFFPLPPSLLQGKTGFLVSIQDLFFFLRLFPDTSEE